MGGSCSCTISMKQIHQEAINELYNDPDFHVDKRLWENFPEDSKCQAGYQECNTSLKSLRKHHCRKCGRNICPRHSKGNLFYGTHQCAEFGDACNAFFRKKMMHPLHKEDVERVAKKASKLQRCESSIDVVFFWRL